MVHPGPMPANGLGGGGGKKGGPASDGPPPDEDPPGEPPLEDELFTAPDEELLVLPDDDPGEPLSVPAVEAPPHDELAVTTRPRRTAADTEVTPVRENLRSMSTAYSITASRLVEPSYRDSSRRNYHRVHELHRVLVEKLR
jgi:hypothetical protein